MPWFLVVLLAVAFNSASAQQEEDDLYEPAPPPNAAFVRVLHAHPTLDVVTARVGEVEYGSLRYTEASPYRVVLQGERQVTVGSVLGNLEVVAGSFYTVAVIPDGDSRHLLIIGDTPNTNRARALVTLYNFTEIPAVDLKTSDAAITVLQKVEPYGSSSMIVNPITVTLAAFADGTVIGEAHEVRLERGAAYSVILTGTSEAPQVTWVQSTTQIAQLPHGF